MSRETILNEISIHRDYQDQHHGEDNRTQPLYVLMGVFGEEAGECFTALNDAYDRARRIYSPIALRQLRDELIQTAAVAVQIIELMDQGTYAVPRGDRDVGT